MGIDSSQYSLKKKESLEAIVDMLKQAYQHVYEPKLRVTITSKSKDEINSIGKGLKANLQNIGIGFSSLNIPNTIGKIQNIVDGIKTMNLVLTFKQKKQTRNVINLSYSEDIKNTFAYIDLKNIKESEIFENLSNFLIGINEYSEFGPKSKKQVLEIAKSMIELNSNLSNQNQWIYKTGCIDFEPSNETRTKSGENYSKSISGLKVQFSKIHALAYKANGLLNIYKELNELFEFLEVQANFTTNSIAKLSIFDIESIDEYYCNFYYDLNDVNQVSEIIWVMNNNHCSIVLEDAKLNSDDLYTFTAYLSNDSNGDIGFDLFIDVEATKEHKERVLNVFDNKLRYIGDG